MPALRFDGWDAREPFTALIDPAGANVGRERDNDIVLVHPSVSRYHARVERRQGTFVVTDLNSSNGVTVNGQRVTEHELAAGDRVVFGDVAASFEGAPEETVSDVATESLPAPDRLPLAHRLFRHLFAIEELLGEGSQASVFRAQRRADGRVVALKVFRGSLRKDSPEEVRFLREGRALAKLVHPAIVTLLDAGRVDDVPYFALELLPGGSLARLLDGPKPTSVAASVDVGLRLCDALSLAHGAGILHRDIKPANIMLDASGRAVLSDFGLAKLLEETGLTTTGVALGTPLYMAPEQFAGKEASVRSDVYSLAATLYHLLAGRPPIQGRSVSEIAAIATNPAVVVPHLVDLNPDVPRGLAVALAHGLARDPAHRTPSAVDFGATLEPYR